mgnify:CR=1 FL=1
MEKHAIVVEQEPESPRAREIMTDDGCKQSSFDHLALQAFVIGLRGRNRNCHDAEANTESRTEADIESRTTPKAKPDGGCLTLELEGAC